MATRTYIGVTDFDAQQAHFTIEGVDNQYYLRIGALNSEDQRLIESLIDDGFVGFFQDEIRIGIAGIVSTYDAENDRIEIDRDPELQIEDAYIIRFTQARPGEDGEGGIGTPGEDGEHAEIEIEDTDTGIRVRGKSGGEPDFGPWQDVRDGIDGEDGKDGEPGEEGEDGEHAEIEIEDTPSDNENAPGIRVRGKSGGEANFGDWHYVQDGQDGEDGTDGNPGAEGADGEDGWSPIFAIEADGDTREVLKVVDWAGGEGTKPAIDKYVGTTGFVDDIAEGVNIRGTDGTDGEDADLSDLIVKTRGELIATSSFLPQDPPGRNLRDDISWNLNPNSEFTSTEQVRTLFTVNATHAGELTIPYDLTAKNVHGIWVVTEDLADNDTEPYQVFIPWGFGNVDRSNNDEWIWRYVIHFGVSDDDTGNRAEDVYVIIAKRKTYNHKAELAIVTSGDRNLPSSQCRVKIYLAGVFLSVSSE